MRGGNRAAVWCVLALLAAGGAAGAQEGYKRPELLVETAWLAAHANDRDVRVLDVRNEEAYRAGHAPGAVWLDEGPLRTAADRETWLPKPSAFAAEMGRLGVARNTRVVVYDEGSGRAAARLWYVLNAYGHARVSLVNGGWKKWAAEGRAVATEAPTVKRAKFTAKTTPALSCPSSEILARKPGVVSLDARSPEEYKAGRVPGAVNVDWNENLTRPALTFKPADALRRLYADKGVTPDKEVVVYCAGGGRASHSLFALALLGYPKIRVYYGSWSDYTQRPNAPVEK